MTAVEFWDKAIELDCEGQWEEARAMFYHLLEAHTDEIEEWNIRQFAGSTELCLGNYTEAISQLTAAASQLEASTDALNYVLIVSDLAEALYRQGQYLKALEAYERAMPHLHVLRVPERCSNLYLFHLGKGRTLMYLARFDEALLEYLCGERALLHFPVDEEQKFRVNLFHFEIGRAFVYQHDLENAESRLKKVQPSLLDPSLRSKYHNVMVRYHVLEQDYEEAWSSYEAYLRSGAATGSWSRAEDAYLAGKILFHLDRRREAREHFHRAISIEEKQEWVGEQSREYLALILQAESD